MASAVDIAARVGRVLTQLRASEDPDAEWFAEGLALWLAGAPFDGAMGLSGGWRDAIHRPRQRAALAAILEDLPPMTTRAAARDVASLLRRYESTAWLADRATGRRPSGAAGSLYDYLAAGGPTGDESIRKTLAWVKDERVFTQTTA